MPLAAGAIGARDSQPEPVASTSTSHPLRPLVSEGYVSGTHEETPVDGTIGPQNRATGLASTLGRSCGKRKWRRFFTGAVGRC